MGIDTKEAEELYLEAKAQIRNKKYGPAMEGIEEAKKTVKAAYAKGIKGMLELRTKELEKKIREMESQNLDTTTPKEDLKKAKSALSGKVNDLREGYKLAKEGLRVSENRLSRFYVISNMMKSTRNMIRPMDNYDPKMPILEEIQERLKNIENLMDEGKLKSAESQGKALVEEVEPQAMKFKEAAEAISSLRKAMQDADVLEANLDYESQFQEAHILILKGRFTDASKIALFHKNNISSLLDSFREAKHEVDLADEKVKEVKGWGFSAYEAEKALNMAEEALKNHEFEKAKEISLESREMAGNIRDRHKQSLEMIQNAKKELELYKT
jgi:hypothetical protein